GRRRRRRRLRQPAEPRARRGCVAIRSDGVDFRRHRWQRHDHGAGFGNGPRRDDRAAAHHRRRVRRRLAQSAHDPVALQRGDLRQPRLWRQAHHLWQQHRLGYWDKLRIAGAQARKVMMKRAAETWKVPVAEVSTEHGMVVHKKSGKKISYGALAKTAKVPNPMPQATKDDLKPASAYRYIGKD